MNFLRRLFHGRAERGQVLVIVAVGLVAFLGFAGLVTDIGLVYAQQREARSLSDASALAGAQELQLKGTRAVSAAQYTNARREAMRLIVSEVIGPGAPLPGCGYNADFVNCPIAGTPYAVSIATPSPICVDCNGDNSRAVRVHVRHSEIPAFFSRLFGQDTWTINQASVATVSYEAKFAVITLRPPKNGHPSQNDPNVSIDGSGSSLSVTNGDIGTNTNLVSSGSVILDDGYRVHHYDKPQEWVSPPIGHPISELIPDPMYTIPLEAEAEGGPWTDLDDADLDPLDCLTVVAGIPSNYVFGTTVLNSLDPTAGDKVTCYRPGIYNVELAGANGEFMLLTPGLYFFNKGADLSSTYLVGGWEANQPGVALVFNECNPGGGGGCALRGEAAHAIALNAGDAYPNAIGNPEAAPAETVSGAPITTTGIEPAEVGLSIIVRKDPVCVVEPFEPSPNCSSPKNSTLKLRGGAGLYVAGVQYAATDNVSFSGNSSADGFVGQIISWTVTYSGGTDVSQIYPGEDGNGILRLDEACSGAGSDGMSNPDCAP